MIEKFYSHFISFIRELRILSKHPSDNFTKLIVELNFPLQQLEGGSIKSKLKREKRLTFEANLVPLEREDGVVVLGAGGCGDVEPQRQRDLGAGKARAGQPDPEHLQRDGHLSPGRDVHPGREQRHHPGADSPWNTYHVVIQLHRVRQLRTERGVLSRNENEKFSLVVEFF